MSAVATPARRIALVLALLGTALLAACGGEGTGDPVRVYVPVGASFGEITDSLASKRIIDKKPLFKLYARARGKASGVKPGTYGFKRGTAWARVLDDLNEGRVLTARLVIPEAWDLRGIAPRLAEVTGRNADSILKVLFDTAVARRYAVPGPTLEGYLYPATYTFPLDAPLDSVLRRLVTTYQRVWTDARRARAAELKMSERDVVALASIVEKEARQREEMPTISAVYHNRLRIGYRLDADPTVQYALGEHQRRLLYAHIESVAEHPYNTYRHYGLPPGPIASPSTLGIDAALNPTKNDYLYFVARPDGSHIFTRSLEEHNRAKAAVKRMGSQTQPAASAPARPRAGQ
jgi:UPF0755 protein